MIFLIRVISVIRGEVFGFWCKPDGWMAFRHSHFGMALTARHFQFVDWPPACSVQF